MKIPKIKLFHLGCLALLLLCARHSPAAGLLVADGGLGGTLEIKEHNVDVAINNGIAVTKVTEVFQNTEQRQVEALYTFPVPRGASVANFSMWINGKEMLGEVLEKKRAREIYESYKQVRRDPGLLEQVDYKTFEMRIFPIAPRAEQKVQITYYQELEVEHDWATYVYPLATSTRRELNSKIAGKFAFTVNAKSLIPIAEVESPSHASEIVVAKHNQDYYQASLEQTGGNLARDIVLAFHLSRPQSGFDLLTSKPKGEDGYFCLTLTPGDDLEKNEAGMDYIFLLDISGSMADDGKLLLSKDSVDAFVKELSPEDHFEVLTFNVQPNLAFHELRPATEENKVAAIDYLRGQTARGGTILSPALTTAFKYSTPDRPLNIVILSDGLTEQQDRTALIQLSQSRPGNTRVFSIGVGNDVNRQMLEQVAEETGGLSAFLSRGDNFERQAKAFRRKLVRPAATGLEINIAGVQTYDIEPQKLPNLYYGSPVRVYGRYKGSGKADVQLRASVNGRELKQSVPLDFTNAEDSNPEIGRMWAWHRIDGLLKSADAKGNRAGVQDEVVRLGEGYSIATEYTSFLVLENDAEYQRWKIARQNLRRMDTDRAAQLAVQKTFEKIRNKALADIGPEAVGAPAANSTARGASRPQATTQPAQPLANPTPAPRPAQNNNGASHSLNFGGGGGPVGPLFVLVTLFWRKFRKIRSDE
jgi:Ca-activated chloride channel family protein